MFFLKASFIVWTHEKYCTHWQEWVALLLWLLCHTRVRLPGFYFLFFCKGQRSIYKKTKISGTHQHQQQQRKERLTMDVSHPYYTHYQPAIVLWATSPSTVITLWNKKWKRPIRCLFIAQLSCSSTTRGWLPHAPPPQSLWYVRNKVIGLLPSATLSVLQWNTTLTSRCDPPSGDYTNINTKSLYNDEHISHTHK